jgi:hypothetical protein
MSQQNAFPAAARHALGHALHRHFAERARLDGLARALSLGPPPPLGVDGDFARATWLLRAVWSSGKLEALAEAAGRLGGVKAAEEISALIPRRPEPRAASAPVSADAGAVDAGGTAPEGADPAGVTLRWPAARPAYRLVSKPPAADAVAEAQEGAAPRPAGSPAAAPPRAGAESWLVRRVHIGTPSQVDPGAELRLNVAAVEAEAGTVAGAPPGARAYNGAPLRVDWELEAQGAATPDGAPARGTLLLDPADARCETAMILRVASDPGDGVDLALRFYAGGFEVGRARAFVPNRARPDAAARPGAPGALVVPDSVLGLSGEDAVRTLPRG